MVFNCIICSVAFDEMYSYYIVNYSFKCNLNGLLYKKSSKFFAGNLVSESCVLFDFS